MLIQRAKLLPPTIASEAVVRPRIQTALAGIPQHRLTLVAAPSGFGKTTAVRQWQASYNGSVAWLTLDENDADPERLIRHVIAALRGSGSMVGRDTLDVLADTSRPAPAVLAEILAEELFEEAHAQVLVLDECEQLHTGPSWQFIDGLIRGAPGSFQVVCLSRIDPPLRLTQYRLRGQLLELRGADLQFSFAETESLLELRTGQHAGPLASSLHRQTHGWAAAITLAAVALRNHDARDPLSDDRVERAPFEALNVLAEEVLAGVQSLDRHIYGMAALVDPISPRVLASMLGRSPAESEEALASMQRAGLARSVPDESGVRYQLHPLFRDLFLHQVTNVEPASVVRDWHARAATALEQQHEVTRAVRHWLLAEQQERALDLLETVIPDAFQQEKWGEVAEKLSGLPDALILARPSLAFGWCWTLFVRGQWGALNAFMERVAEVLETGDWNGEDLPKWSASFDVLRTFGVYQSNVSPGEMLRLLEAAAVVLDVDHSYVRGYCDFQRVWALQAAGRSADALRVADDAVSRFGGTVDAAYGRAIFSRALLLRQQGAIAEAETTALANIEVLRDRGFQTACAWLNLILGWIAYARNDLDLAISRLREVVADYRDVHALTVREAMSLLAVIHALRGEIEESWAVMRRLREILGAFGATELMPGVLVTEAWLANQPEQPAPTIARGLGAAADAQRTTTALMLHPAIVRIRLLLDSETPDGQVSALAEIESFRRVVVETHCAFRVPQLDLLESVLRFRSGATDDGLRLLQSSLRHPASRYLLREYLDYPREVEAMIGVLRQRGAAEANLPIVAKLQRATAQPVDATATPATPAKRVDQQLIRLLTAREYAVLEGLARRLSYKEIADDLSISPATVKRHAGNVYLKLDAKNRRDAVARAVDLGFTF